jgi:TRAP-type mannitol/chloroaromatic compound transport system permease large subunit
MSADASARFTFRLVDALQGFPKGYQARAVAMLFYLICEHYKIDPIDLLQITRKATKDALSEGRGEHIRAVQNYLKGELT